MKLRAPLVLAVSAGILVLSAGAAWAGPHGGVAATVAPDGTFVFTTTNGPADHDITVTAASYTGLWKTQTEPEKLFRFVNGTIATGTSRLVLHVEVPSCGPYQLDAFLGTDIPATISFPEGSGPNGLKGQEYPNGAPCSPSPTPTPTPTPSPSVSPTTTTTHTSTPSPTTSVLGVKLAADAGLAATGPSGAGPAAALGLGLLLVGAGAVTAARRTRRH